MRIIAGTAGGTRLDVPAGTAVRPTSDRAREALFSLLASRGLPTAETRVLDLFAGSGALALEALSRGAAEAWAVDHSTRAAAAVTANAERARLAERLHVLRMPVARFLARPPAGLPEFGLVFADPPYQATRERSQLLEALAGSRLLAAAAVVVVERSHRSDAPAAPAGWSVVDERRWGEAAITILSSSGEESE